MDRLYRDYYRDLSIPPFSLLSSRQYRAQGELICEYVSESFQYYFGVIGPGFLNQVPTFILTSKKNIFHI